MTLREVEKPWEYVKLRLDTIFKVRIKKFHCNSKLKNSKKEYEYV